MTIDNEILRGVVQAPPRLSHVFTEFYLDGGWFRLDSYIVDPPLRKAALAKLRSEGRKLGYGCHVSANGKWDGTQDSFW